MSSFPKTALPPYSLPTRSLHLTCVLCLLLSTGCTQGNSELSLWLTGVTCLLLLFPFIPTRIPSIESLNCARFVYYQVLQLHCLLRTLVTPGLPWVGFCVSVAVMTCELSPHHTYINALIVAKNTCIWSLGMTDAPLNSTFNFYLSIGCTCLITFLSIHTETRNLSSLIQSFQTLERENQLLNRLFHSISDGVLVLTNTGQVVSYNPTLLTYFPLTDSKSTHTDLEKELRSLYYLKELSVRQTTLNILEDLQSYIGRKDSQEDYKGVTRLNESVYEFSARLIDWNDTPATVVTIRDVSHWVKSEQRTHRESEDKTAMLRSVSHELRTPTNAILNLTQELLEKETLTQQGIQSLHIIASSTAFLLSIIGDLLDYNRIITGNFQLNKQMINTRQVVTECMTLIVQQCTSKGLQLKLFYDSLLPEKCYTDPIRLKQVILNLLSNALKFTLKGSIEVTALLNSKGKLTIRVTDTGIGISSGDMCKMFKLFGKVEGNEKINPQGCGLGLSISNKIVEELGGGCIAVMSKVGKGSIFAFDVDIGLETPTLECLFTGDPTTDVDEEEEQPVVNNPLISHFEKHQVPVYAKILIVDDSDFNRIIARKLIETRGFLCDEAATGRQALDKVRERMEIGEGYKLILMDIEMPEMDGITATREIRGLRALREQPLIVGCSAYSAPEDKASSLAAGMDHYLEKPLQRELLYELLTHLAA